jgi:small redox-active disulfide protein 2
MKKLQILGPGCPRCNELAVRTTEAAKAIGGPYELEKVTEVDRISGFGVSITPALVVDGVVKVVGWVPSVEEIKKILA